MRSVGQYPRTQHPSVFTEAKKSPAIWRGFRSSCCGASAVLLALLAALAGAARLLLLLLAGLLLPAAMLTGLVALLLLAGILVGILVLTHPVSFQLWLFDAPRPNVETTPCRHIWFRMNLLRLSSEPTRETGSSRFDQRHND